MTRALVGVLAALPGEGRALAGRGAVPERPLSLGSDVTLLCCGIGARRAGAAARALLASGAGALVSWGTAAGLAPGCEAGDVVVPRLVVTAGGGPIAPDEGWRTALVEAVEGLADGAAVLAEAASLLASPADKSALHARTGARVADMESAAIGAVAAAAGVPWIAVRAVCDGSGDAVPGCVRASLTPRGTVRPLPLLAGLARHPAELAALLRLGAGFAVATGSLRALARRTGPRLAAP